jgi:hypothetical protein
MHLRSFKKGKKKYYFIAETSKKGKKVIQKYILYVGSADRLYEKLIKLKKY